MLHNTRKVELNRLWSWIKASYFLIFVPMPQMRHVFSLFIWLFSTAAIGQNYVPGDLLIQLNHSANPEAFVRNYNANEVDHIIEIEELSRIGHMYRIVYADSDINLDLALKVIRVYPEVTMAQKNHYVYERETIPTDDLFPNQWHLKNDGTDGGEVDADIDATDAWDQTTGGLTSHGDTIVVCVIEGGGVDITHVDLQENIWHNYDEIPDDGIDNDGNGYLDDFDGWNINENTDNVGFGSHGTRVTGVIGAKGNNALGISGVNWDIKMMIIKGVSASNEASVIASYSYPLTMRKIYNDTYGEKGAFVVATNASWGIDGGDADDFPLWCAMYDTLGAYGILNVGATTNNNLNVEESGDLPTNCTSEFLIGVTMTNNEDQRANSGYGTTSVDLGAPGRDLPVTSPGDGFTTSSGTSFAAPVVTGAIGLAYSAPCPEFINLVKYDPQAAALAMRGYMLDGVDPVPALASEVATGGRLNVNNSINLMLDECDPDACIPPYNLRITEFSDTSASLIWNGFVSDYEVLISEDGSAPVAHSVVGDFTIEFDTLLPCTNYTFTVRAFCDPDWSETSFTLEFTTDGCCINPPLILFEKTENSLTIDWEEVLYATSYDIRYAPTGTEDWTVIEGAAAPMVDIDALSSCTNYDVQIYTLCGDSTRGFSDSYAFRTLGCGACTEQDYCPVNVGNSQFEWIDTVKLNGGVRGSGDNGGWLNSGHVLAALTPGESYILTVKPDFLGSSFTERYSVYIDFNQNGVFDIPEERLVDDFSFLGTLNQNLFIPADASLGITKIRIAMAALNDPTACPTETFFGEYEDYCVYIGPQASIDENQIELALYPNPTSGLLNLSSNIQIETMDVYSSNGVFVKRFTTPNNLIDLTELAPGMYYLSLHTIDGVITKKVSKE